MGANGVRWQEKLKGQALLPNDVIMLRNHGKSNGRIDGVQGGEED